MNAANGAELLWEVDVGFTPLLSARFGHKAR